LWDFVRLAMLGQLLAMTDREQEGAIFLEATDPRRPGAKVAGATAAAKPANEARSHAERGLDFVELLGNRRCKHVAAVLGDENVVFDANAAHVGEIASSSRLKSLSKRPVSVGSPRMPEPGRSPVRW